MNVGARDDMGAAREEMIRRGMPLVRMIACRMARRMPPFVDRRDLLGAGYVGLLLAVRRHDAARPFEPYATRCIRGAILDALRGDDPFTRHGRMRATRIDHAIHELRGELMREPNEDECARRVGLTLAEYRCAIREQAMPVEPEDLSSSLYPPPDARLLATEARSALANAVSQLSPRHQRGVELYYWRGWTQLEIAQELGVTESRVCQILSEAARRLRERLVEAAE